MWALLLAATIPWRTDVYFDGAIDGVVIGKAVLSLLALAIAAYLAGHALKMRQVAVSPVLYMCLYLGVTVVGGMAQGDLVAASIVAARVLILMATISLLFVRYRPQEVMSSIVDLLAVIVVVASITGAPSFLATGRLSGGIPPLNANEMGLMASVCIIWLFAKMLQSRESALDLALLAAFALVVLLTGSRSSLAALCVALVVMPLRATVMSRRSIGAMALLAPGLGYVAVGTDVLSSVFLRGGERGVTTLSNRTVAWDAAISSDRGAWEALFGAGLATKKIAVPGQSWNVQLLDSSWISALVQGGLIGLVVVAILAVATFLRAATAPKPLSALWLGLVVFLCARGVLESGLFDSSTAFMVLLVAMLGCRAQARAG